MPYICSLEISPLCQTVSNTLNKSQNTMQQNFSSSILLTILWQVSNNWITVEWPGKKNQYEICKINHVCEINCLIIQK